ncbi:MAG: LysR family transcriptional regulator [Fusobacteria bacterium]|nr:LysR family transcriptional regulator [Fusobacteriota bacterium]
MNLNNAQTFYTVAKYKSFTKVATLQNVTQGAISTRIKNLELEIKTILLIRNNSEVILTPDGEKLFFIIEKMLFEVNDYEAALAKSIAHHTVQPLLIGISSKASKSHYYHKPCAALYSHSGPPIIVHDSLKNIFEKLKNNEIDAIFTARYQVPKFEKFKIGQFTLTLCANSKFNFDEDYEFIYPNYFFLTGSSPTSEEIFPDGSDFEFQNSEVIKRVKGLFSLHPQKEASPFLDDFIYLELIKTKKNILTLLPDFLIEEGVRKKELKLIHVVDLYPIFCYHKPDIDWKLREKLLALRQL